MNRWSKENMVSKTFDKELAQLIHGELADNHIFDLGRMPGYLVDLGGKDSRFTHISATDLCKFVPGHLLPDMKGFAASLQSPVAVFRGQSDEDLRVILDIGKADSPHYLSVAVNKNYNAYPITGIREIASTPELKIMKLVEQDRAVWMDKDRLMAIYGRQHLRGHQNGNINMNYAKTVIEHFNNPGKERAMFDIDDYLDQVGGRSLPYTGSVAVQMVAQALKNVVDDGRSVRYPVNIGTTGYFKDKNGDGKTIWTAFDNTTGDCYVEDFSSKQAARAYALKFEEADYAREVDAQQGKHETEYLHPEHDAADDRAPFLEQITISEDALNIKDVGTVAFGTTGELEVEMVFSDGHAEELPALDNLSTLDRHHFAMTYPTVAEVENDPSMQEQIEVYTGRKWQEGSFQEKVYDTALRFGTASVDQHHKIADELNGQTVVWTEHDMEAARQLFNDGQTIGVMTSDRNPVSSLTTEVYYTKDQELFYNASSKAETFEDVLEDFADWQENDGYGHMPDHEAAKNYSFSFWTKETYPLVRTQEQHAQQAAVRGDDGKALTDFLGIVLPKSGYDITFDHPVHAHYTGVDGLHDIRIKEVVRVIGGYVMDDGRKRVRIEHLTADSKAKLLTESVAQCAREAVFIRATGPSNHFVEEERRFINIATRGMTASEKDTYFSKLLSDLEPRFKNANTPQVWVDDVREELEDLANGKAREEGWNIRV